MFREWSRAIGIPTLAEHDVLSTEETLEMPLANGFRFTGRLDETTRERSTSGIWLHEHKSTAWSLAEMERTVALGDQVPGYLMLWKHAYPDKASQLCGCLLDVTYARGRSIEARRSRLYYDASDLARLELNINGILSELSQKIAALHDGAPDALLFPRSGAACSRFRCPYEAICRRYIDASSDLPETLKRVDDVSTDEAIADE